MIKVCKVKIGMKCVHPFGTGRHKRQADIALLCQYRTLRCELFCAFVLNQGVQQQTNLLYLTNVLWETCISDIQHLLIIRIIIIISMPITKLDRTQRT